MRSSRLVPVAIMFILALLGCQSLNGGGNKPSIIINSPPSGSSFHVGDDVQVQSTATDSQGITRVELQVDGNTVRVDPSPVAQGQAQFSIIQKWKASGAGTHNLLVRAYNSSGASSDAGLTITIAEAVAVALTDTPTIPTVTPAVVTSPATLPSPTNTQVPSLPTTVPQTNTPTPTPCTPNSQFVADLTIPDGTTVQPGSSFVKTWRVLNNGTCAWDSSYSVAFLGGTAFVLGAAPIPPAAPGAVVDVSLTMSSPTTYGSFSGSWRFRAPDGTYFGTNLTTVITVPNPNPPPVSNTPAPTATNTPLPGAPHIASFTCSPCTIAAGSTATLNWGMVSNATSASIDQGIGDITTPGQMNVTPGTTTTYTLTANGPGGTSQATVTITVVGNFAGHWDHNFGHMDLTQNGANVTGTYFNAPGPGNGTIAGTVSSNTLTGTWLYGASGSIQFTLGGGANTFTGNWNGSEQWCGARTGVSYPSGCAFDGHWNTRLQSCPRHSMFNGFVAGGYYGHWHLLQWDHTKWYDNIRDRLCRSVGHMEDQPSHERVFEILPPSLYRTPVPRGLQHLDRLVRLAEWVGGAQPLRKVDHGIPSVWERRASRWAKSAVAASHAAREPTAGEWAGRRGGGNAGSTGSAIG